MLLRVDFKSGKPVYLQVVEQIQKVAASGTLRPDEALPAIGRLAGELRVNRNVIARAYAELEGLGFIELRPDGEFYLRGSRQRSQRDARPEAAAAEIDQAISQVPVLLHKALTYSLLAILLAALFAGLVWWRMSALGAAVALAAALWPLRKVVERLARRIVFAKRFEFPRGIRLLKAEAWTQPNLESFMQRVAERTQAMLGAPLELMRDHAQVSALVHSFPGLRSARVPIVAGADRLMPVFSDVSISGVLRLGPKSTGQEYNREELKFLAGVCELVAATANHFSLRHDRQESEYALDIQRGLLPREIPQIAGFTIAGLWQPARTVGGDYYDVFQLTETDFALVVADVSGKGIPAALLMSNLQATVKAYAFSEASPKDLCARVNRAICKTIPTGKFVTFFYGVLDTQGRRLTYTNAGHSPPLLVRQGQAARKLEAGAAVLGVFAEVDYEQDSIELLPEDRLLLFTDGITEAMDPSGREFGEDRLVRLLKECPAATATDLCRAILQEVTRFCREDFADDATLLTLIVH
jgi:DNA-binding transcriptional regulator YhcF (GntR family)